MQRMGALLFSMSAALWLSGEQIDHIKQEQSNEITAKDRGIKKGQGLAEMAGRTVILVDDGLANGSTMRAAIMLCRKKGNRKR
jgi:putative phosphoribosyl transferase